jgi:hypothetical protein
MELLPEQPVDRVLEWYLPEPADDFVGEEVLVDIGLDELRAIFQPTEDDPEMLMSYEVETVEEVAALQPLVKHPIDLAKYAYFIAAYQPEA